MEDALLAQLRQVFSSLSKAVVFRVSPSDHPDFQALHTLLSDVVSTSPKLSIALTDQPAPVPRFLIATDAGPTGISFTGIPTGHEFTSLIVAILNANGQGRLPDDGIQSQIKQIRGPVRLRTFISLTCENCPEVVQALNQMALIHPDFYHEMVDGAYAQDEVSRLGIQGVPSVMAGEELVSSGRATMVDLINRIGAFFGQLSEAGSPGKLPPVDVAVLGGGPAGVSAAIYSARKGLRTAVIADKIGGQLNETQGIENFISVSSTTGAELATNLRHHAIQAGVTVYENRWIESVQAGAPHVIRMQSGETICAKTIVVATGAKWRKLNVPGETEYLGKGVAYCPHCDGPFYKGKDIVVVGGGNSGVEAAIDLAGIVKSVTVIEFSDSLKADQVLVNKLNALPNTAVIRSAKTTQIDGDGTKVTAIRYEDRVTKQVVTRPVDGIFVQIGLVPNSQFITPLVDTTPFGEIVVDQKGRTSVPGIYAAGDVTTIPHKQIVIAMGDGAKVGLTLFEALTLA